MTRDVQTGTALPVDDGHDRQHVVRPRGGSGLESRPSSLDRQRGGRIDGYWRVRLRLRTASDGGRPYPIVSGWRASWDFGERTDDGVTVVHDAPLLIEGSEFLDPGEEAPVRLHPLAPHLWPVLSPGDELRLWEAREIGDAVVIEHVAGTDEAGDA